MPSSQRRNRSTSESAEGNDEKPPRKLSWKVPLPHFGRKSQDRVKRADSKKLFEESQQAPAIGGCVDLAQPHSAFLLPPEVLLFEPSLAEIFQDGAAESAGSRNIFLNTPLNAHEVQILAELHQALRDEALITTAGDEEFPNYVGLHALRLLQHRKFNVKRALDLILTHLEERVRRLPIIEKDVLPDLHKGFMYWHGRDKKCRPCCVIRIENMGDMSKNRERAVRLVIFVLEYAIRFAMVPGRVENWVVILDLANASKVVSMFHLAGLAATAKVIGTTLESVYCGRMVWMKIINMPSVMRRVIESCIPAEKKKKVQFASNPAAELRDHFEPNQLEARYGGTAPDLAPSQTYPFHFFPGASPGAAAEHPPSLHEKTTRAFHEGKLWDTSQPEKSRKWIEEMQHASLTPSSAAALSSLSGGLPVKPCCDTEHLMRVLHGDVDHAAATVVPPSTSEAATGNADVQMPQEPEQEVEGGRDIVSI
mmetsp:Transcript_80366/g.236445  ORF Transcript_80366/g.236445 Transcript_80366/m.236445 type:complete len:480 (-) Transcript_80366:57-1496(-)